MVHKLAEVIRGDLFPSIADFVFSPQEQVENEWNPLYNTYRNDQLFDGCVIYTHTHYVSRLFDALRSVDKKVVVVTHNSDVNVSSVDNMPDNVGMWFTQNLNVLHIKLRALPIGLENSRWWKDIDKTGRMNQKLAEPRKRKGLVYMNHNVNTNILERQVLYDMFFGKSFVTAEQRLNGQGFQDYLDNLYSHDFIFCPVGNGIDTHRVWESLYMGTIPIIKRTIHHSFFMGLPICFVNKWEEVNERFLREQLSIIKAKQHNMEMLNFSYWKNIILKYKFAI